MTYPDDPMRPPPPDQPTPPVPGGGSTAAVPPGEPAGYPGETYPQTSGGGYPPPGGSTYPPPGGSTYPPPGGSTYPPPGGSTYPPPGDPYSPAAPGGYPSPAGTGGSSKNWMGIAALVLGVVSLLLGFCAFAGFWAGIPAIVLGILGIGAVRKNQATNRGLALAGIVTGALGLLLTIGTLIFVVAFNQSDLAQCIEDAGNDQAAQQQCTRDFTN